jgi:hypothetical protein
MAAAEAARGSHEAAATAIARATGVRVGKRQLAAIDQVGPVLDLLQLALDDPDQTPPALADQPEDAEGW